jgi:hypothetical protein
MAEMLLQLAAVLGVGVGAYAAIRADLAALHIKADHAAKSADQAHQRIDAIITRHQN